MGWRTPIHPAQTQFIGCGWYKPGGFGQAACPGPLVFNLDLADVIAADFNVDMDFAAVFNGGTKSGVYTSGASSLSCGSDTYVTVNGSSFTYVNLLVDVWSAFKNGAWSSSVIVDIYGGVGFSSHTIKLYASRGGFHSNASGELTKSVSVPARTSACPATKLATATVYDNGTFTLA